MISNLGFGVMKFKIPMEFKQVKNRGEASVV